MRSDGDLVTIERSLGLKSERGISRQGNKDNPIIQELLADIKTIALQYTDKPNTEIRASSVLEQNSLELFGKFGPLIWPSADEERPNWLAEPSAERYDGKYPRALHHDVPEENQILSELFHALVVEKCVKYHDNQLQKARRLTRKSEIPEYEDGDADVEFHGNNAPTPYAVNFIETRGGQVSSPASVPHGLPYSGDQDDELDSQDDDVFSDGSGSRTKSQRLQDYRDEIARASESYLIAADGNIDNGRKRRRKNGQETSSKRMREISDGDAPRESLIVHLQVNREALSRLVGQKSEQRPDVSHRDSAPREEHRDASGTAVLQQRSNSSSTHTPPPPATAQEPEPAQRRSSGFHAINASHDAAPMTAEPAPPADHAPASAPVSVPAPVSAVAPVPVAAPTPVVEHPVPAPIQPMHVPFQPAAAPPRRSSAANPVPLRIVPVEIPAAEGQPPPSSAREQPNSSELSDQSYTTAATTMSGRSSAQPASDVNHIRDQSGTKNAAPRNGDPPPSTTLQTAAPHHPPVQPLTLTSQPLATFRDHAHGHHAFRVHRPFVPQQQHPQQNQQHQHQHPPQHPHQHQHQHQSPPQPQPQQHQPPQHQPPQHQLQHQFVAHPPPLPSHQQHAAQRHMVPQQHNHQHQIVPARQILPASSFSPHQQAPPVRRPSPHQILHSNVRRSAFVEEILGDLIRCPVVTQILAADSNLDQQQLNNLKTILTNHPETRNDMEVLLTRMNSLMDPGPPKQQKTSPNLNHRPGVDIAQTLGNPGHLQRTPMPAQTPPMRSSFPRPLTTMESPRLKSEPMEEDKLMSSSPHPGSFENVSIEINWGRELEFSDYMEMQFCSTTKEFFSLVEAHIPDEISADGHTIKEIRVKALKDLKGGNLLPRIVRDEGRGRAAIRHLVKRLKAQPPESEPELMFNVVWDDKLGA